MPRTEVKKPLTEFVTFFMGSTKINIDLIVKSVGNVNRKHGKLVKGDEEQTVSTWDHKPTFTYTLKNLGNDVEMRMGLTDWVHNGRLKDRHKDDPPSWNWVFANKGTSIRWAVMSSVRGGHPPDWKSKTSPNTMRPGAGAGHVVARGYGIGHPRKGIESRNWLPMIDAHRRPAWEEDMKKTLARISKKIWL